MNTKIIQFFSHNNYKNLFFLAIFITNVLQAYLTNFNTYYPHEAYYWIWSRDLAWGYYDHPPLVAFLIKIGYLIMPNELGVRLPFILLYSVFLYIIEKIIQVKNYYIFYGIILNLSAINLMGIFAVPDVPLLTFTALFFYIYKYFIKEESYKNSVLLGLVMALLVYSKYNGILVIICVIVSNAKLLVNRKFYLAVLIGILLYLPHLYWQYLNWFPSIMFHLSERYSYYTGGVYSLRYTLAYIGTQIAFYGPLGSIILFYYAIKSPRKDMFNKALKFCFYGTFIFFLLYSYKSIILVQWTIVIVVPLIALSYNGAVYCKKYYKTFKYLTFASIIVSVFIRASLIVAPNIENKDSWFWKPFKNFVDLKNVLKISHNLPVVFVNEWKGPSLYEFYAKKASYSVNNIYDRKNQYNYILREQELWGKEVILFERQGRNNYLVADVLGEIIDAKIKYNYYIIHKFYSFSLITLIPKSIYITTQNNGRATISLKIKNSYTRPISEQAAKNTSLIYTISDMPLKYTEFNLYDILNNNGVIRVPIELPGKPGKYTLKFGLMYKGMPPTHNSPVIFLNVI